MQQTTYSVPGISCEHCRTAITSELANVDGIAAIDVDLAAKHVTITGSGFEDRAVIAAIDEAGYDVAGTISRGAGAHGDVTGMVGA
jgi:copper chaperone CopZ